MQVAWQAEDLTLGYAAADREAIAASVAEHCVVAELDGRLVGYAYGAVRPSAGELVWGDDPVHFEVEDIYVVPELRSHGVGAELFRSLEASARQAGVTRLKIYSATRDIRRIMQFYEKLGLTPWYIVMFK
ncbi:MAG TPA: GNAT family N-acetyltransferase [Kofleriaceae bacterium]|jgi:GNAT superfamily N-acetyltransferase